MLRKLKVPRLVRAPKRAPQRVRQSESRLRLQIDRMPIPCILWNTQFRVLSWNPAAESMFGYTEAEALGRHPYELIVPAKAQLHVDGIWERLVQGDTTAHSINRNVTRAGHSLLCEWSNTPLKSRSGKVLGVLSIVQDVTERKQAEEALLRSKQALQKEILEISEREQRRLGQDLHDDLCQQLAGIEFLTQRLALALSGRETGLAGQAVEIAQMVQQAMTQTRELARGLCPVRFGADGLSDGLRELAARTSSIYGVRCRLRCLPTTPAPDPTTAIHLYRIAQEAVGNAVKHGKANHILIVLHARQKDLCLEILDDGVGFQRAEGTPKGMGLQIMRYRAEAMGGRLTVEPRATGGTALGCRIPGTDANPGTRTTREQIPRRRDDAARLRASAASRRTCEQRL